MEVEEKGNSSPKRKQRYDTDLKKFTVYKYLCKLTEEYVGQLFHVDLVYITPYIFRLCKINDTLTREDKRKTLNLARHLEKYEKEIFDALNDEKRRMLIIDSIIRSKIMGRKQLIF